MSIDLPPGHPFNDILTGGGSDSGGEESWYLPYWSATTNAEYDYTEAWVVDFYYGDVLTDAKTDCYPVWCVRGGYPGPRQ